MAGDFRTSEQPSLVSMHTLFLREHNRIAKSLKQLNPGWGDERLYQESRKILIAEWQHVIYNEWIPVLIGNIIKHVRFLKMCYRFFLLFMVPGSHCTQLYGLTPLTQGFSKSYKENIDPRVTNEFAAAAFRIGHTLIPDILKTFNTVSR